MITLIAYHLGWAGVAYAGFCRAQKLGPNSRRGVRVGIGLLTTAGMGMLIAPIAWHVPIAPVHALVGAALAAYFVSVQRAWRDGPPEGLVNPAPRQTLPAAGSGER